MARRLKILRKENKLVAKVPLSEAIKKIGVRSAFGVTALDLHRYERIDNAMENTLALLEVEGQIKRENLSKGK